MEDIIKPIAAPSLESSEYGQNIKDQFKNIDNNFKFVSNRDFIKGDSGESLYIENIILKTSGEGIGKELYDALNSAIGKRFNSEGALNPVNDYNWDDAITSGELNVPIIASENKTTGEVEYICAASPAMLFDNRFNENAIENVDFSEYEDVVDVTSILNFKKDGEDWVCELNLSYPRLQYKGGSFHWVINNVNTIVKSTGIKGDPGESANIWIVRSLEFPEAYNNTQINIADYFVNGKWVLNAPENIKDGDLAIVHCESEAKEYYGFFVSQIKIEDDNNTVVYNPKANIQNINYVKNTTEFFKSLGDTNAARGMFLRFDPTTSKSTESHIFYNEDENLYIKPVGDYNYTGAPEDYAGSETPSINIEYAKTNVSSEIINVSSTETNITSNNKLNISGTTSLSGDLTVDGVTNLNGNVTLGDNTSDTITIEGVTDLKNGLNVTIGNTSLSGDLTVTGATNLENSLSVNNGSTTSLSGDLMVDGITTLNGNVTLGDNTSDTITIEGVANLENGLSVNNGSNTSLSGDLTVTCVTTLNGDVTCNKKLTVSADSEVTVMESGLHVYDQLNVINGGAKFEGETIIENEELRGNGLIIRAGESGGGSPDNIVKGGTGLKVYGGEKTNTTHCNLGNSIEATGDIVVTEGSITVENGGVSAKSGFFETSDERLKDFTGDIDVCLNDIAKLPKKYFTWKDDDTKIQNIGTSAQEIQKLYPELVSKDDNGNLSVAYDKLSVIALKAIDVLNEKNKELEERIKKLENLLK